MGILTKIPIIGDFLAVSAYPVQVLIFEQAGNAIILKTDRGRRDKKDQVEQFHLAKDTKEPIEPPKYADYIISPNGKRILPLFKSTTGEYTPIKIKVVDEEGKEKKGSSLTVTDKNALYWHVLEHRRNRERFMEKSFWEKYIGYITLGVTAVLLFLMILYTKEGLSELAAQFKLSGFADIVARKVIEMTGQAGTTTIPLPP